MAPFTLRELRSSDVEALLAFESLNQAWFEAHIDARDPAFYSPQGVAVHIESYLADFAAGTWHPLLIEDASGQVVGRANLKGIDPSRGSAEVGYRVARDVSGQGLATLALRRLIEEARGRWALTHLVGYAFKENVGSRKVLERCGFVLEPMPGDDAPGSEWRFVLVL